MKYVNENFLKFHYVGPFVQSDMQHKQEFRQDIYYIFLTLIFKKKKFNLRNVSSPNELQLFCTRAVKLKA